MTAGAVHETEGIETAETSGSHETSVIQGTDGTIVGSTKINAVIDERANDPQTDQRIDKTAGVSLSQNQHANLLSRK
jgi:hypothetical protein